MHSLIALDFWNSKISEYQDRKLSEKQALDAKFDVHSTETTDAILSGKDTDIEEQLSDIDMKSWEIINYTVHGWLEKVFAIIELNTKDAASVSMQLFNGTKFKNGSLLLKYAKSGMLLLSGIPQLLSTKELFTFLHPHIPHMKSVNAPFSFKCDYALLNFDSFKECQRAIKILYDIRCKKENIDILGNSYSVTHADPFIKYDKIWNVIETHSMIASNVNYSQALFSVGQKGWVFPYKAFPNLSMVRVYADNVVLTVKDPVMEYFFPNTSSTFLNFDFEIWDQKGQCWSKMNNQEYEITFPSKTKQQKVWSTLEPCTVTSDTNLCKIYGRHQLPNVKRKDDVKKIRSACLSSLYSKDRDNLLKFASGKCIKDNFIVAAQRYLEKQRNSVKNISKIDDSNRKDINHKRHNDIRNDNTIVGSKRHREGLHDKGQKFNNHKRVKIHMTPERKRKSLDFLADNKLMPSPNTRDSNARNFVSPQPPVHEKPQHQHKSKNNHKHRSKDHSDKKSKKGGHKSQNFKLSSDHKKKHKRVAQTPQVTHLMRMQPTPTMGQFHMVPGASMPLQKNKLNGRQVTQLSKQVFNQMSEQDRLFIMNQMNKKS